MRRLLCVGLTLASALSLWACAMRPSPSREAPAPQGPAATKRVVAAVLVEPQGWAQHLTQRSSTKGLAETQQLLNANLTYLDDQDAIQPQLAEAVPSAENGLWKVSTDGRMEVTWRLKPGLRWQDGAPFTSADLLFSAQVIQDEGLELVTPATFQLIEAMDAPDPLTLVVKWREVFIDGDKMSFLTPMSRAHPRTDLAPGQVAATQPSILAQRVCWYRPLSAG